MTNISNDNDEPLLIPNDKRLVLFPLEYPQFMDHYKLHMSTFWTPEEIELGTDIIQFKNLSNNQKHFIKHVLAFFASSDGIVNENLALNFYSEIQSPEARCFYGFQIMIENVHSEVYSLMIDTFADNATEKDLLLRAITTFPAIKKLTDWTFKWINNSSNIPFRLRVVAMACVEGILFSGPFCAIFWFKRLGLLPGLCYANELISKDEALHTEMATIVHKTLKNPASYEETLVIVKEIVELEKEFIIESLPCDLLEMNSREMSQYIEYVADKLLLMFGFQKYYKVSNPFQWMDLISSANKTNFFERRVGEYSKHIKTKSVKNDNDITIKKKELLDDF